MKKKTIVLIYLLILLGGLLIGLLIGLNLKKKSGETGNYQTEATKKPTKGPELTGAPENPTQNATPDENGTGDGTPTQTPEATVTKAPESGNEPTKAAEVTKALENGNEPTKEPEVTKTPDQGEIVAPTVAPVKKPEETSKNNTGNLTETGSGTEGIAGTGAYNYGEALQKSLLFYELQRSGKLPEKTRSNWRGDSALDDGKDVGLDLTGGWFDAGDNVKFNLPMAYSAAMLGWSILEDTESYRQSGQLTYALDNIKWANDYFIKCHPKDEVYYYQVGDGNKDHTYWGSAETVSYKMSRPAYCVTKDKPGSAVCGETAASLAICSLVYREIDPKYSDLCLSHAKSLYAFARSTASDAGYTAANGFYNSWSGFYDELAWAGSWLYLATKDNVYLSNAKSDYTKADQNYKWAMCWDDVHIGAALILARITKDTKYSTAVEEHLDWWTTGTASGERITYTPKGLAWLDSWGSLRYATTTGFLAAIYSEWEGCKAAKADTYWKFAVAQAGYALGDTGFSYEIGFGDKYPQNPHHRTAQGSYCDNMNEPATARHTLYGALVGGPDANDGYQDEVSNYTNNEVACDYNAGFTGLLAKLYGKYHGKTLVDFGAVEKVTEAELYVRGGVNVTGSDFMEFRVFVCNTSAWPARVPKSLELRYFMDFSEIYMAGGSAANVSVKTNYMQGGKVGELVCWDAAKHIYYLPVDFSDAMIYPGGQDAYKKEIQVRIQNAGGVWDNSNDPSFDGMVPGGNVLLNKFALYENGKLVFGEEPASGTNAGQKVVYEGNSGNNGNTGNQNGNGDAGSTGGTVTPVKNPTAKNEALSVTAEYSNLQSSATSLSGNLLIKNESDGSLKLSDLKLLYFFTNEENKELSFACYHAAVNTAAGVYRPVNGVSGAFEKSTGKETDTVCSMTIADEMLLEAGDTLTVQFCINHTDWSFLNTSNDYSVKDAEHIVVYNKTKKIFGTEP